MKGIRKYHHLTLETAQPLSEEFLEEIPPCPEKLAGRGITICGGGLRYFTCAWVCIRMLRHFGCRLPIQLWHLGEKEMTPEMKSLVEPFDVECVDGEEIRKKFPMRMLSGWELKPFSIVHSPFREVIALDADNVPLCNPEFLFETDEYHELGALFWPDYGKFSKDDRIWDIIGTPGRDEPQFESGQIVIDKSRCWEPLRLALWYNEHSDFYYRHILGDKDTFHLAFRKLEKEYAMPSRPIVNLADTTMCQHDFEGNRIFQHRNLRKWEFYGENRSVPGFLEEERCLGFLRELQSRWDGRLPDQTRFDMESDQQGERSPLLQDLITSRWLLQKAGEETREVKFRTDGTVFGGGSDELFWDLIESENEASLTLSSEKKPTSHLAIDGRNWRGMCQENGRLPIRIVRPVDFGQPTAVKQAAEELIGKLWAYRRVGHDHRSMEFLRGGTIGAGAAAMETFWHLVEDQEGITLSLEGFDQITCKLRKQKDGENWGGKWLVHEEMDVELLSLEIEISDWEPGDAHMPGIETQLVTQQQIETSTFRKWCRVLGEEPRYHRRQWEFVYVMQALEENALLVRGSEGLAVGTSFGPTLEAVTGYGCRVSKIGELHSNTASASSSPDEEVGFDFAWDVAALSGGLNHLGLEEKIFSMIRKVRPGGLALITTDFVLDCETAVLNEGADKWIPDQGWLEDFSKTLEEYGHRQKINLCQGRGPVDQNIDRPPFSSDHHLKLDVGGRVVTSLGMLIRVGEVP